MSSTSVTTTSQPVLTDVDKLVLKRQILDWRDTWLIKIPIELRDRTPAITAVINARIETISFTETFKAKAFAEQQLGPVFDRWRNAQAHEIIASAKKELRTLDHPELCFEGEFSDWSGEDTSAMNSVELGFATGTAGAALFGIPAVASMSVQSAGWGLGLLGATVISWPIALSGAAVLGTMAVFGGSRISKYKEKAVKKSKDAASVFIRMAVFAPSSNPPSLCSALQGHIRAMSLLLLEDLKHA
ncbi:hypothetical protein [Marinobacter sp. C2H3]|uniref:hypothetical protein n=1 Tax=Marinobacter sp. C2H3 TaxID=3119003 RepID=UPI00300F02BE